jgi:ribonucleotide monophosphatase NagD (HAD superfamily)
MGLPDGSSLGAWNQILAAALARGLPVFCTNPDRSSPRADGLVMSPGALAFAYKNRGGLVRFYGKPHLPVFESLQNSLKSSRLLMVGDSLEHDIAGAQAASWDSLLIQGGLYAEEFANGDPEAMLAALVAEINTRPPTYRMGQIR